jgi:hypothetical protein
VGSRLGGRAAPRRTLLNHGRDDSVGLGRTGFTSLKWLVPSVSMLTTADIVDKVHATEGLLPMLITLYAHPTRHWLPTEPSDSGGLSTPPTPTRSLPGDYLRKKRIKHNKGSLAFSLLRAVG